MSGHNLPWKISARNGQSEHDRTVHDQSPDQRGKVQKFRLICIAIVALSLLAESHSANAYMTKRRPSAIFYLDASKGCYSLTYQSTLRVPYSEVKKLYRVSCNGIHHYEIFASGDLASIGKSSLSGSNLNAGKSAISYCVEEFRKLKFYNRSKSDYNWTQEEEISMGNWIADTGPELVRYADRFVCYLGQGIKNRPFFKEVSKPLTRGFEKYEN